ncbi:MAG TPA: nucleoside phosphorylase [Stellaceae bacterium]|nr:nucleoside phosphorylase [Stellaceae bacterium]
MRVAAITGLAVEARIARGAGLVAVATGGDAARTEAAAERLLAEGASALLSFGIAGGLDPGLAPGSLLLPRLVRSEDGATFPVDAAWRARVLTALRASGLVPEEGDLLGAARIVAASSAKAELHRRTGAIAVDLESHVAAQAAAQAGRPFLALRAVADPAWCVLPAAAVLPLDDEGRPRLGRVLLCVLRDPRQIPALLRVARDTARALTALRRAAAALR